MKLRLLCLLLIHSSIFAIHHSAAAAESSQGKRSLAEQQRTTKGSASSLPNVIYILADDLGYGDISCFGQKKLKTPNIDRLATEGIKLTDHYSANTVCTPSRHSLMAGQHAGHCLARGNGNENTLALREEMTVLPEVFKAAGYTTGMYGKWGLGITNDTGRPSPLSHGFDEFSAWKSQMIAHTYFPTSIVLDGKEVALDEGTYVHDLIMAQALAFVEKNAVAGKPFFCYIPTAVPHAAMHAPKALHEKYRKIYPQFENKIGKYSAGPGEPCPDVKNPIAGYAGMMENLDNQIGQLLDLLEKTGQAENTLIFFSSDNGSHLEGGHDPRFWDSNGPLRGHKRDLYEGGIRAPSMAHWPGTIKAGTISALPSAQYDILATVCDLLGQPVPAQNTGISLLPTLTGKGTQQPREYLYWEHPQSPKRDQAVRIGKWKGVKLGWKVKTPQKLQLFDLEKDIGETKNIAAQHPDIVKRMEEIMVEAHQPLTAAQGKAGKEGKKGAGKGSKKKPAKFHTPQEDRQRLSKVKTDLSAHDPALPNVLILGDSISIAYTPMVIEELAGKANVSRPKANCGPTTNYLKALDNWLTGPGVTHAANTKWDIIHFNAGLHDLCYRNPDAKVYGKRDKVNGTLSVTLEDYEQNLETIVQRLKKTGATIIFANTTVVPEGEAGRKVGDDLRYNEVAAKVMARHGIAVNDLQALTATFPPKLFRKPGDVHYTEQGSQKLADQVCTAIAKQLDLPKAE